MLTGSTPESRPPCPGIRRRVLASRLRKTVEEACRVLRKLSADDLAYVHTIQEFRVKGLEAVFHVAEHFSHHSGQIILLTKMLTGSDLEITHLAGEKKKKARSLPAL